MKKISCTFSVPANTQAEAEKKFAALSVLATFLTAEELEKFAWVAKNQPGKISLAKAYLGM